jgi:hypothetical protein
VVSQTLSQTGEVSSGRCKRLASPAGLEAAEIGSGSTWKGIRNRCGRVVLGVRHLLTLSMFNGWWLQLKSLFCLQNVLSKAWYGACLRVLSAVLSPTEELSCYDES